MPEPKRSLKVFLSYASQDKPSVRELSRRLVDEGWVETWQDEKNLLPGQDWRVKIEEAVEEADVVIIVLSQYSVSKEGHVQKELRYAREIALEKPEEAIFLIPLRLDECEVPRGLRFYQWVDYFGEKKDSSYKALIASLKLRFEQKLKAEESETKSIASERSEGEAKERRQKLITIKPKLGRQSVYWFGGFSSLILGLVLFSSLNNLSQSIKPTSDNNQSQIIFTLTYTEAVGPSATVTPEPTSTPASTLATPLPTEITDAKGETMVLVPAGDFIMGSDNGKPDENPAQKIYLDAFYIDKYEVTNALYKICVRNSVCVIPSDDNQWYAQARYADHPVMYVTWNMARAYCEWSDARLPTEAEWEKAARGTDGRTYPWGNTIIDCGYANYRGINGYCVGSAGNGSPVGSYENGKSPYGVYDLMGNAVEWVSSLYLDYPYSETDGRENLEAKGPRVIRGGSWNSRMDSVNSTIRAWNEPSEYRLDYGFRCAKDAP